MRAPPCLARPARRRSSTPRSWIARAATLSGRRHADARSIMAVLALGIGPGDRVRIEAEGPDADRSARALARVARGRGPARSPGDGRSGDAARSSVGRAAPGIAPADPSGGTTAACGVPGSAAAEPSLAMAAHVAASVSVRSRPIFVRRGGPDEAGILEAQALIATDPALLDDAERRIAAGRHRTPRSAPRARTLAARLTAAGDPLIAARAADVLDVGDRVARVLTGAAVLVPDRPSIAVADDLPPSVLAELPGGLLLGVALEGGSPTAHAAILARARGVPAVVGLAGLGAAVDAAAATADAAAAPRAAIGRRRSAPWCTSTATPAACSSHRPRTSSEAIAAARGDGAAWALPAPRVSTVPPAEVGPAQPCATADGVRILLAANIGRPEDAARALAAGAEGVGLFRTEALFLGRADPPSEREQRDAYRRVMAAFGPDRPVVIRLADIGGDKADPVHRGPGRGEPVPRRARDPDGAPRPASLPHAAAGDRDGRRRDRFDPMGDGARWWPRLADVELFRELRDEAIASLRATGIPRRRPCTSG